MFPIGFCIGFMWFLYDSMRFWCGAYMDSLTVLYWLFELIPSESYMGAMGISYDVHMVFMCFYGFYVVWVWYRFVLVLYVFSMIPCGFHMVFIWVPWRCPIGFCNDFIWILHGSHGDSTWIPIWFLLISIGFMWCGSDLVLYRSFIWFPNGYAWFWYGFYMGSMMVSYWFS